MLMPDVNLLVYAHRVEATQHERARAWLEALASGRRPFALSALVAVSFVRVVTGTRLFKQPESLGVALDFVEELLSAPACRLLTPGLEHWQIVARLCLGARAIGAQVADAQHAALAIEHGCTWVTADDDFSRYEKHGLDWQHLRF
jgi:toxin-antitoxin system PIN domain toxin